MEFTYRAWLAAARFGGNTVLAVQHIAAMDTRRLISQNLAAADFTAEANTERIERNYVTTKRWPTEAMRRRDAANLLLELAEVSGPRQARRLRLTAQYLKASLDPQIVIPRHTKPAAARNSRQRRNGG